MNYKMDRELIYEFKKDSHGSINSIPVFVFIKNLPPNSKATVHSTSDFTCDHWYIFYSVRSGDRIEFFYDLGKDSNDSGDYELTIDYSLTHAIRSFNSTEEITFVDSRNNVLVEQPPIFSEYEYAYNPRLEREYKMFLVIYRNTIVICWNDDDAKVIVKTFDLSSFFSSREYGNFTRVEFDIELTDDSCKITFYTESPGNRYFSAYLAINPLSNEVNVVLKENIFDQMCDSSLSGSQFKPDTCDTIWNDILVMTHYVDGKLQENDVRVESDNGSEEESDADSEDDD